MNVNGTPTCVSKVNGSDPTCVPYNIFQLGRVTREKCDQRLDGWHNTTAVVVAIPA